MLVEIPGGMGLEGRSSETPMTSNNSDGAQPAPVTMRGRSVLLRAVTEADYPVMYSWRTVTSWLLDEFERRPHIPQQVRVSLDNDAK